MTSLTCHREHSTGHDVATGDMDVAGVGASIIWVHLADEQSGNRPIEALLEVSRHLTSGEKALIVVPRHKSIWRWPHQLHDEQGPASVLDRHIFWRCF